MQVILFLALLSILVAGGFLFAFFWAVRSGQYEDEVTPAIRILFDETTSVKQDHHDDDDTNV